MNSIVSEVVKIANRMNVAFLETTLECALM